MDASYYSPASPFELGEGIQRAVERLGRSRQNQEKVTIWGDFDADGVTATAVLWEGLGHWFTAAGQLSYYIPDRFTQSHGLCSAGIRALAKTGTQLIVTCDTGSADTAEIALAQSLGIDVIVTDHHSLPKQRPEAVALINPRSLPPTHPLADLSGVAVAYKLIEALQQTWPVAPDPLPPLLELVAMGLIADLVALRQDSRYLAQLGLQRLQALAQSPQTRPGVAELLKRCQRSGDRPTDISFGIGPRINAVSRIQGDARLCVELLTSRDQGRCRQLADQVELLNTRRKALQQQLTQEVRSRLTTLDLSTTAAIVLAEVGWPLGVLGLVASDIARETGKPTVLLSLDPPNSHSGDEADAVATHPPRMARGSARSVHQIDFYPVLASQRSHLSRFGGHPYAAGLMLPVENLALFTEGINQALRSRLSQLDTMPPVVADLAVTVAELGPALFRELKLLEPCGMGNPVPQLLIRNCRCTNARHFNLKDAKGSKIRYLKTQFQLVDESSQAGFPGLWWGHNRDDLPQGVCDVVGELDFNAYQKQYEFRLVAVRPQADGIGLATESIDWLLDWRKGQGRDLHEPELKVSGNDIPRDQSNRDQSDRDQSHRPKALRMEATPATWNDFRPWLVAAQVQAQPLALAYGAGDDRTPTPQTIWITLLGITKYLSRTGAVVEVEQIRARLGLGELGSSESRLIALAWGAIADLGFEVFYPDSSHVQISGPGGVGPEWAAGATLRSWAEPIAAQATPGIAPHAPAGIADFIAALQEICFRHQYFLEVPMDEISTVVAPMLKRESQPPESQPPESQPPEEKTAQIKAPVRGNDRGFNQ